MKHNAAWFFNFFNSRSNWTTGRRYGDGKYCAIGHLQSYEGAASSDLEDDLLPITAVPFKTPLVLECADVVFGGCVEDIWKTNDRRSVSSSKWTDPKGKILKACRLAILRENPECQLGKEYDI